MTINRLKETRRQLSWLGDRDERQDLDRYALRIGTICKGGYIINAHIDHLRSIPC